MGRRSFLIAPLAITTCLLVLGGLSTAPARASNSSGMDLVSNLPDVAGNDIAVGAGRVYVSDADMNTETGKGIAVIDGRQVTPRVSAFISCDGFENDLVAMGHLLVVGFQHSRCAGMDGGGGLRVIDTKDPTRPRYLGDVDWPGGAHTITRYPGTSYVYASPGGSTPLVSAFSGQPVNPERIIDVSDPRKPEVVATFTTTPAGCHDLAFDIREEHKIALCIGEGGTQVWDVEDPLAPSLLGAAPLPQGVVPHSVAVSADGEIAVVASEDHVHECAGGDQGGLHIYDISNPQVPVLLSTFKPSRSESIVGSFQTGYVCVAHNFAFIGKTRELVSTWFSLGTSLVDLSDPESPAEVAFFDQDDSHAMAAYAYRGLIYVADQYRGVDILRRKDR